MTPEIEEARGGVIDAARDFVRAVHDSVVHVDTDTDVWRELRAAVAEYEDLCRARRQGRALPRGDQP